MAHEKEDQVLNRNGWKKGVDPMSNLSAYDKSFGSCNVVAIGGQQE